jgi:hypothetical protein
MTELQIIARADARRRQRRARRAASNARTQRYRARIAAGAIIAPVTINHPIIDMLIDFGWLAIEVSEDRTEIGAAIGRFLADASTSKREEIR